MQQIEIEVTAAQPCDAAPRSVERACVRGVLRQDFAGDEEALAHNTADRLTEHLLDGPGAVHLGGVEVRHSQLDAAS